MIAKPVTHYDRKMCHGILLDCYVVVPYLEKLNLGVKKKRKIAGS